VGIVRLAVAIISRIALRIRSFDRLDQADRCNDQGSAGKPDGLKYQSLLDDVSDVTEWQYFNFHGCFPLLRIRSKCVSFDGF
jgi:hypothetical protein